MKEYKYLLSLKDIWWLYFSNIALIFSLISIWYNICIRNYWFIPLHIIASCAHLLFIVQRFKGCKEYV